jgi:ABC-type polysaccharide/polyol phosphate transport system ATPase subunit
VNMDAIVSQDLTKTYRVGVGRARIREMLPWPLDKLARSAFPRWWDRDTFNAVDGLSFSVERGSSVAVVGHNGAGKTTLLRLIAGITSPSAGSVVVHGRVAALIDVLVGFHPDLTGRENIYLLGSVYGFGRREMASRLEGILEFAEIDHLADTPLKRYSAGMGARLGFGTLTALNPDILLIDEVLAVGDAAFQRKCLGWLETFRSGGGNLVFVSHNLSMVRSMTERAIWLDHGRTLDDGPTHEILKRYARAMEQRDVSSPMHRERGQARRVIRSRGIDRWGSGGVRVARVHVEEDVEADAGLAINISYEAAQIEEAIFCVAFADDAGRDVGAASSLPVRLHEAGGNIRCTIRPIPVRSGVYFPIVAILTTEGHVRDRWRLDRAVVVETNGASRFTDDFAPVQFSARWEEDVAYEPTGDSED